MTPVAPCDIIHHLYARNETINEETLRPGIGENSLRYASRITGSGWIRLHQFELNHLTVALLWSRGFCCYKCVVNISKSD